MELEYLVIPFNAVLRNALEKLNKSGLPVLFVIDDQQKLVGILTDGIIRRSLLSDYNLDSTVSNVMKKEFISFPVNSDNAEILNALNETVRVIPLVDEENRLVDYASIYKIRRISMAAPLLDGNELAYVTDCIKTNWISSQGKYVRKFEELFSKHHNNYYALAVSNGTVALHLALMALRIGESDEVMVPDLTFAASANAILYTGAVPILIDIDPVTLNMDINKLESCLTPNTKAIMPVHLYGNPCNMDAVMAFARKHNLYVIEDCAEALGSYYKGQPVGVFGDVSTFSFYGNKTITTGEGGMVVIKNKEVAERANLLRDHGMNKTRRYWHDEVGYNYRITNLQAAIGVAQFERLDDFVSHKRNIAKAYNNVLSKIHFFQPPSEEKDCINSYWLYTFLIKPSAPFTRDELINYLAKSGIETRPVFYPLHIMPPYRAFNKSGNMNNSKSASACGISLPSFVNITETEIEYICKAVLRFIEISESNKLTNQAIES